MVKAHYVHMQPMVEGTGTAFTLRHFYTVLWCCPKEEASYYKQAFSQCMQMTLITALIIPQMMCTNAQYCVSRVLLLASVVEIFHGKHCGTHSRRHTHLTLTATGI
jgi:hypothetical protein